MRDRDLYSSIFWFLVGMGFVWGGGQLSIGQWNAPGPGFLPALFGGILSGLSTVLFIQTLSKKSKLAEKVPFWKERNSWKRVTYSLSSLVLYMLVLNSLGYLLSSFLLMSFSFKCIGEKGWVLSIMLAVCISFGSYLVFQVWLETPLPKGIFRIG